MAKTEKKKKKGKIVAGCCLALAALGIAAALTFLEFGGFGGFGGNIGLPTFSPFGETADNGDPSDSDSENGSDTYNENGAGEGDGQGTAPFRPVIRVTEGRVYHMRYDDGEYAVSIAPDDLAAFLAAYHEEGFTWELRDDRAFAGTRDQVTAVFNAQGIHFTPTLG